MRLSQGKMIGGILALAFLLVGATAALPVVNGGPKTSASGSSSSSSGGASQGTLSWTPPTQNVDDSTATLTGYNVYAASNTIPTTLIGTAGAGATSYSITGLTAGTYYFTVKAVTAAGESSMTEYVTKVIP